MKQRGIVIIALGHPWYGRMAHNLALGIRHTDKNIGIALVHNDTAITHLETYKIHRLFDHIIPIQTSGNYFEPKTRLYDLSPFEETVYIDADTMWLPVQTATQLFDKLQGVDFTAISEGYYDMATNEVHGRKRYTLWASLESIKSAYGLTQGRLYKLRSEFMYFKKCERVREFFDYAKLVYNNPEVKVKSIGKVMPDEFAFNIASSITGLYPQLEKFNPVYWLPLTDRMPIDDSELYQRYYALGVGGAWVQPHIKMLYDRLAQYYFNEARLQHPWLLKEKRSFLDNRRKI